MSVESRIDELANQFQNRGYGFDDGDPRGAIFVEISEMLYAFASSLNVRYVVGMMDEVEMNRSRHEASQHPVYGPYDTYDEAETVARALSLDPNEAVIMELHKRPAAMRSGDREAIAKAKGVRIKS